MSCQTQSRTLPARKEQLRAERNAAARRVTVLPDHAARNAAAPYGLLTQAQRHLRGCQRQWQRLEEQQRHLLEQERRALTKITALQRPLAQLQARRARLAQENIQHGAAPRCRMRMDAGFCSGDNLTLLLELGYEIETKVGQGVVVAARPQRVGPETVWTRVGKNAEMIG